MGSSVTVTVSASKVGYVGDVTTHTLAVDLTAPSASYTAPVTLKVYGSSISMAPRNRSADIDSYSATGLPPGLSIVDPRGGSITGSPNTANPEPTTATVTVTDTAGNSAGVSIEFPPVAKGDQILRGFRYSLATLPFGDPAPTVTAPSVSGSSSLAGVDRTGVAPISYSAVPADVCAVDEMSGALTFAGIGPCTITATAAMDANYDEGTATATVTVVAVRLVLNLDRIAADNTVNMAEHEAGFAISGYTRRAPPSTRGSEPGVTVSVTIGSQSPLTATSEEDGAWSVSVPANAAYITEPSVTVTVSATKSGFFTAARDVERTLTVDLAAPSVSYPAPTTLKVGVAITDMAPSTSATDLKFYAYGATGCPRG